MIFERIMERIGFYDLNVDLTVVGYSIALLMLPVMVFIPTILMLADVGIQYSYLESHNMFVPKIFDNEETVDQVVFCLDLLVYSVMLLWVWVIVNSSQMVVYAIRDIFGLPEWMR